MWLLILLVVPFASGLKSPRTNETRLYQAFNSGALVDARFSLEQDANTDSEIIQLHHDNNVGFTSEYSL